MDYGKFFHLAGKSRQKGTQVILDLWKRHPDWPLLKVIQDPSNAQPVFAKNIEYTARHVDDTLLAKYQNLCGLHLCPSEAEGFGHYITEAMSCKAVTITTNSPPMNELVTNERGKLVSFSSIRNQRLGVNCYVASSDLEQKVEEVLCMSHSSKARLGENARDWYRQNDQFFRKKMLDVVKGV
jgi:glycosyltransferase involved in cell wall biosynthesis